MIDVEQLYAEAYAQGIRPDPLYTVSQWADEFRILGAGESAEPGPWRTSRTPYLREIMDVLSPNHPAQRVVFMKGARVGGTEVLNNFIGHAIDRSPSAILMVCPTGPEAKAASKERIAPMIRETPTLQGRVADVKSRDGKNTILTKEFTGGRLVITGGNSAAGLSARTVRRLGADEIDQWPTDVDGEGDPLRLAEMRCSTYGLRCKMYETSAPTVKGRSRIEKAYLETDQRRYFIPCPWCGHMDFLTWDGKDWFGSTTGTHHRIAWPGREAEQDTEPQPEKAAMECSLCHELADERWKTQMLERGEWRATAVPSAQDLLTIGYHLSGLYSPVGWLSWGRIAREFVQEKKNPLTFQVWVNKRLGETWEDRSERVPEPRELLRPVEEGGRVERYPVNAQVPNGVGVLVAGVDKQASWLEVVVRGYGVGHESWLVDWTRFEGDTARDEVWLQLEEYLTGTFDHASGRKLRIEGVAVDARYQPDNVYEFCKAREARRFRDGFEQRVFCVQGGQLQGVPLVASVTKKNRYNCKVFSLCTDTGKGTLYARLRVDRPGPGYMHLPDWGPLLVEYIDGLTANKPVPQGGGRKWVKLRRDEVLDCEVYGLAALDILGPVVLRNLGKRASLFNQKPDEPPPAPAGAAPSRPPRPVRPMTGAPRGGWMSRVKK